ncbi:protein kinase, ATP binding site-containing protein [Tanacetum coccineum]
MLPKVKRYAKHFTTYLKTQRRSKKVLHKITKGYARAMIDLRADGELKDTIVVAMPKLTGEGFNLYTIRVDYESQPPRQATKGVPVSPKVSFKSTKQIYRPISNKNGANTRDDADLGTNEGNLKSAGKGTLNVTHGSSSNTPITDKINKIECQIFDGKLTFLNDNRNPLVSTGNVDSDSEVEVVFDETVILMASTSFKGESDRGYDTNSLLEQWRETKRDDDYIPYDDDLYESHDMSDHLPAICNNLDITNHGAASNNSGRFKKLEDSLIPLNDINKAIGVKGPETRIGDGGFGVVYKGQPSERWQNRTVAIKCLRPESYQGEYEFRNELNMIFSFNHENIIPFIGYCDEGNEKVIVYEYASNGSLDCHINDKNRRRCLTWEHRLKICLGAARGLDYLHSGLGEDNKVIHRDVKSANILLDHNLVAKICDFGLSKSGPVNQLQTQVYTNAAGTNFYMDPIYHESGVLRKESDVYSFGVVMFELLSGMLAYNRRKIEGGKSKPLINIVRRYYHYKPELLIDPLVRDEIDIRSFDTYSKVAFQCISFNSKERPTMETIVDRIEEALEFQVSNQTESQAKEEAELKHPGSLE